MWKLFIARFRGLGCIGFRLGVWGVRALGFKVWSSPRPDNAVCVGFGMSCGLGFMLRSIKNIFNTRHRQGSCHLVTPLLSKG